MISACKSKMGKLTQEKTGFSSYAALLGGLESAIASAQSILADEESSISAMRCNGKYTIDIASAIHLLCRADAFIHATEKI